MTTFTHRFASLGLAIGMALGSPILFTPTSQAESKVEWARKVRGEQPSKSSSKKKSSSSSSKKKSSSKKSPPSKQSPPPRPPQGGSSRQQPPKQQPPKQKSPSKMQPDKRDDRRNDYNQRNSYPRYSYPRNSHHRPAPSRPRYSRPPVYVSPPSRTYVVPSSSYGTNYQSTKIYRGIPAGSGLRTSPSAAQTRSMNMSIQSELRRRGYYRGAIDGILGPQSQGAIAMFRRDHSLRPSHVIDSDLLTTLFAR